MPTASTVSTVFLLVGSECAVPAANLVAAEQAGDRLSMVLALRAPVEELLLVELEQVGLELDWGEAELGLRPEDRDVVEVVEV